jgi:hypothetical protein
LSEGLLSWRRWRRQSLTALRLAAFFGQSAAAPVIASLAVVAPVSLIILPPLLSLTLFR